MFQLIHNIPKFELDLCCVKPLRIFRQIAQIDHFSYAYFRVLFLASDGRGRGDPNGQLSIEDSLTCHTNSDTDLPFIMVISKDPWYTHLFRAFGSGAVTTCFYHSGLSRPGIEPRSPACEANALPLRHRVGLLSERWPRVISAVWEMTIRYHFSV